MSIKTFAAESVIGLIAQLETSELVTVVTTMANDERPEPTVAYTRQLLGLYIDGNEVTGITAIQADDQFLLPLITVLENTGINISTSAEDFSVSGIRVYTPGGDATLYPEDIIVIDGQVMVTQLALAERFLIQVEYDQSTFALHLSLPWTLTPALPAQITQAIEAQYSPPAASLRNMRADLYYYNDETEEGVFGDYFFAGNLAGGAWRFRVDQDEEGATTPLEYYWTTDFGKSQALIGNSDFSLHPLLPTIESTGVQILYSSSAMPESANVDMARSNSNRQMANGTRNISGVATPGSVAELRVDGGAIARTRVRLDGTFDFPRVDLPTRGYSEVVVLILDRNSGALIESQDFSRRSGIELLNAGQHTVFATLGEQGNSLDNRYDSPGAAGAAQWRYGLTEDLTLELGTQQVNGFSANEASISMALSNYWFGSLGYADSFDRSAAALDLEGGNERWQFDATLQEYELKQPASSTDDGQNQRQWSRSINYRFQVSDNFGIGIIGRDSNTSYEQSRFVLPSISWSNRRNLSISAMPNIEGRYRIDGRFNPTYKHSFRYAFEDDRHLLDFQHRNDQGQEFFVNYRADRELKDRIEMGMVHHWSANSLGSARFGLISNAGQIGYALDWESNFLPGLNSRFRLSKGAFDESVHEKDDATYLQWHMTLDFAVAQNKIVPADTAWGSFESAALTGELLMGDKRISSDYKIDKIELLIDGDSRTATVAGGRYYVDGLQAGLHKVSIDSRHLPIELMPKVDQSFWVRLDNAAATEVPLALEARFAIAGRVQNSAGEFSVGERLVIINDNDRIVGEAYSDQFGFYRADNLAPGEYRVYVERVGNKVAQRQVTITNEFLFEQDLIIP
jgi:hypothetical protein